MHQPLNEGKIFLFKINTKEFFNEVKPPKEYINRIIDKQMQLAKCIERREINVNLGFHRFFNSDVMKHFIAKGLSNKKDGG